MTPAMRQASCRLSPSVMRRGIVSNKELFAGHRERGIVLRDLASEQERMLPIRARFLICVRRQQHCWRRFSPLTSAIRQQCKQVIADIAPKLLQPNLTFNRRETEERKKQAVDAIKPVFFQVKRGEMIIREGERVREEHIPRLRALASGKQQGNLVSSVAGTAIFVAFVVIFGLLCLRHIQTESVVGFPGTAAVGGASGGEYPGMRAFMVVAHAFVESFPIVESRGSILYALPMTAAVFWWRSSSISRWAFCSR